VQTPDVIEILNFDWLSLFFITSARQHYTITNFQEAVLPRFVCSRCCLQAGAVIESISRISIKPSDLTQWLSGRFGSGAKKRTLPENHVPSIT
jgi:hypothetical protein